MRAAMGIVAAIAVGGFVLALGLVKDAHAAPQTVNLHYDDLGRMTHAIYDSTWVIEYTWDDNGNLLQREVKAFTVGIPEAPNAGYTTRLGYASPNPFGTGTKIRFSLAQRMQVRLDLYDVAGRHIRSILNGEREAGEHAAEWDGLDDAGRRLSSGVYFYVLKTPDFEAGQRLLLLR